MSATLPLSLWLSGTGAGSNPSAWVLPGASFDVDFVNNKGYTKTGGTVLPSTLLTTARSTAKLVPNSAGTLLPFAANILPRTDLGLLPEEARTNLFLRSDDLSNAAWFSGGVTPTVVSSNNTAPDGSLTATRVTIGTGTAAALRQAISVTNNQPVVISVYVKAAPSSSATNFRICTNNSGAWNTGGDQVIALTSSWQRITLTFQNTFGTTVAVYFGCQKSDISADATCRGDVLIWGADFNANNSIPLSHITTTTASVTRSADSVTGTLGSWFNTSAGTFVTKFSTVIPNTANAPVAGFDDGTISNQMYPFTSGTALDYFMRAGGVVRYNTISGITLVNNATNTVGMGYGVSPDFGAINNGNTQSLVQVGLPTVNRLTLGFGAAGADTRINGYIKRFTYFPTRLSNAQIQALTV